MLEKFAIQFSSLIRQPLSLYKRLNSDINSKSIYCIITIHKLRYGQGRINPQEGERVCNIVYNKIPKTVTTTNLKRALSCKARIHIYAY